MSENLPVLIDLVCMTVASAPGTGTVSLGSVCTTTPAGGGVLSFAAAGARNNADYYYAINDGNNRELCYGTYNSTSLTLTRNTITASVNGVAQTTPMSASANAIVTSIAPSEALAVTAQMFGGHVNKFRNPSFELAIGGVNGVVQHSITNQEIFESWILAPVGANQFWSQQWGNNFSGSSLRLNCASGLTASTLTQNIVSWVSAQLSIPTAAATLPLTVQFTISNQTGASITPQLSTAYPNTRDVFTGVMTTDLAATNLQAIPAGATRVVAYTLLPSSAALNNGYQVNLLFGGQLNGASGYVDISLADIRLTPGLPAGLTNIPPPPEQRPVGIEMAALQPPACGRLLYVNSTTIKFSPYCGNAVKVNAASYAIPDQGISGANTSVYVNGVSGQSLAASTLYYVYLFNNGANGLTLDFCTTGHATDTSTGNHGVEIKTGDSTRSLVGMVLHQQLRSV